MAIMDLEERDLNMDIKASPVSFNNNIVNL